MPRSAVAVAVALCLTLLTVGVSAGRQAESGSSPFDGRWVVDGDPWFSEVSTGRGGRGGAPLPGPDVVFDLHVSADGSVSGVAMGVTGRRGAPGSHPAHPVEIAKGRVEGSTMTFDLWRFDGYHNRLYVEARVEGGGLALDFRRDAPGGPVTFATRGRRVEDRGDPCIVEHQWS